MENPKSYLIRVSNYDSETKICIFLMLFSLVNAALCAIGVFVTAVYFLIIKNKQKVLNKNNALGFAFATLSLVVSAVYLNFFGIAATVYFLAVLYIMLRFRQKADFQKINDIFTVMVLYSVIAFAVALIQKIFDLSAIKGRSASTFLNANYYCIYVSFVIIICLYRILFENKGVIFNSIITFINLAGMFLTASKMPWLGVGTVVLIMLIGSKRYKTLGILVVLAVIGGVALYILKDYNIAEKVGMNSFAKSFSDRYDYWNTAINGFLEKPLFGRGMLGFLKNSVDEGIKKLGGFTFNFTDFETSFDNLKHLGWHLHAHNILFDCLYNYGVIGTLMLFSAVLKRLKECYRINGKNSYTPVFIIVVSGLAAVLVDGIVDCQIVGIQTMFLCVFLFALTGVNLDKGEIM